MTSMMSAKIKVSTAKLDSFLRGDFMKQADAVVGRSAMHIEASAKTNAPVMTSALRNSIMAARMQKRYFWSVTDGVEYGIFQELGTSKGVPAKYFLTRAAEGQAEKFFDDVRDMVQK